MATIRREEDGAATREAVFRGLLAHNEAKVGPRNTKPLSLSLRDAEGNIVGGLVGELKWGWLHVDMLWVDEIIRGNGYGETLLATAEREAREHGATGIYLNTGSRQAPAFYEKLGYQEYGRLENYPVAGSSLHHFMKTL